MVAAKSDFRDSEFEIADSILNIFDSWFDIFDSDLNILDSEPEIADSDFSSCPSPRARTAPHLSRQLASDLRAAPGPGAASLSISVSDKRILKSGFPIPNSGFQIRKSKMSIPTSGNSIPLVDAAYRSGRHPADDPAVEFGNLHQVAGTFSQLISIYADAIQNLEASIPSSASAILISNLKSGKLNNFIVVRHAG